ncbi:MAG: hypothetical protein C0453_20685 [Comamonadaceae bacterium]|nr:hypothetical protein [Comamonadaceae bacterium]
MAGVATAAEGLAGEPLDDWACALIHAVVVSRLKSTTEQARRDRAECLVLPWTNRNFIAATP